MSDEMNKPGEGEGGDQAMPATDAPAASPAEGEGEEKKEEAGM